MKILQVIPVFSSALGGTVSVVRTISKELAKKHEVVVYTTTALDSKHDIDPKEEQIDGYRIVYFKRELKPLVYSGLLGQLNVSFEMLKAIRENLRYFDVVHVHSWQQFPDVIVKHYATKYSVPYVLQVHGSLQPIITKQTLKVAFNLLFGYNSLHSASKVIALNKLEARQYLSMGVPDSKIVEIPNGFDFSEYGKFPSKGSFKNKYSIAETEKIVLYLGRIHESKGLSMLAQAFSMVVKKVENTKLVLVGPDDGYMAAFSEIASNLGIDDKVLLTGFVDAEDKIAALVDSEMMVTPQFYGFPVTFLEACLTCCPIITTFNDLSWINNNVGFAVEHTSTALANAISTLLKDEHLNAKFRSNCQKTAKDFDVHTMVKKLVQLYEQVSSNKIRVI